MLAGRLDGRDIDLNTVFETVGKHIAGAASDEELLEIENAACPGCGSCSGMFTANTMNCMMEALGLGLPGNGTIPAVYAERERLAKDAGRAIMGLVERDIKPRDILTRKAFENAVAVDLALGGSTNTTLHLPAIAHSAGFELSIDIFNEMGDRVPHLCSLSPGGAHHIQDLYAAGGVQAVMSRLSGERSAPWGLRYRDREDRGREPCESPGEKRRDHTAPGQALPRERRDSHSPGLARSRRGRREAVGGGS